MLIKYKRYIKIYKDIYKKYIKSKGIGINLHLLTSTNLHILKTFIIIVYCFLNVNTKINIFFKCKRDIVIILYLHTKNLKQKSHRTKNILNT